MSFLLATTLQAAPDVRKVPPRTPPQRLDTLTRFLRDYVNGNIDEHRPNRAPNQERRADVIEDRLMQAYTKFDPNTGLRLCSFFDPTVEHGGPRPVSDTNKRAAEKWVAKELCALGDTSQCAKRKRRDTDNDEFDPFDEYEKQLEQGERATAVVRLDSDKAKALRQVFTLLTLTSVSLPV